MKTEDNTKSRLARWWESISPKIDDAYQTTKEKAEDFGRIGKLKYDIYQTRRILLKCYQELGEKVAAWVDEKQDYNMQQLDHIDDMLTQIRDLKAKIASLEKEVTDLQAEEKIK
ncbi:MAG: hypothetical protein U5N56_04200 [Candidatus Marinimicrobia bacterium]|nr:hypothetical protein [Candidatus Neomarinimicrobiota bacterium]